MKLPAKSVAYAVATFTPTFGILLIILTRYPIVYGIDGPYYIIQLRNLISEGVIKYPDPPLTYYLLLPFYLMVDKNFGLKLAVAFYGGLTALVLYLSFRKLGDLSGLTAAFAFVVSPFTLRLANDFIKNYVSLLFIAIFIYSIINAENDRKSIVYASAAAFATALSHVLSFGVLALFSMIIFVSSFILRDASRSIRNVSASAAVTSLMILAVALTIAPQIVGYDTVKLFSFINKPFENAFALTPFRTNFAASFVIGTAGIVYGVLRRSRFSAITTASGILLILLNLPIIGSAWLFRFSLMSSILIPPIAAIIVGEVEERFRLVAFLLIIGLMALSAIPTIPMLRPSITMKEYFEIQKIQEYIPAGSSLLVPNTKLRY